MTSSSIKVMQRIVDKDRGDCMTAVMATLLGLPYEQVPTWVADAHDENKRADESVNLPDAPRIYRSCPHAAMTAWLRERNLHLLRIAWDDLNDWRPLVGALCIASMPSQRFEGVSHAVVGTWVPRGDGGHYFEIVHDPSPLNKPYPDRVEPTAVSFLVKLDPAK